MARTNLAWICQSLSQIGSRYVGLLPYFLVNLRRNWFRRGSQIARTNWIIWPRSFQTVSGFSKPARIDLTLISQISFQISLSKPQMTRINLVWICSFVLNWFALSGVPPSLTFARVSFQTGSAGSQIARINLIWIWQSSFQIVSDFLGPARIYLARVSQTSSSNWFKQSPNGKNQVAWICEFPIKIGSRSLGSLPPSLSRKSRSKLVQGGPRKTEPI